MLTAGIVCVSISVGMAILGFIGIDLARVLKNSRSNELLMRLRRWPWTLALIFFLIGISLLVREWSGFQVVYGITGGVLYGIFLAGMILGLRRLQNYEEAMDNAQKAQNPRLATMVISHSTGYKQIVNVEKAFSGVMFGDIAITIALMAGAGAYQLSNLQPHWFWLGQMGAILGVLVGLSQALRLLLTNWSYHSQQADFEAKEKELRFLAFSAMANMAISCLTLLALMSPIENNEGFSKNITLVMVQILVLLLGFLIPIAILAGFFGGLYSRRPNGKKGLWIFFWISLAVETIGTAAVLLVFYSVIKQAPKELPGYLALAALVVWSAIEIYGLVINHVDSRKALRAVLIIAGNIFMVSLVIWLFFLDPEKFIGGNWILFCAGVTLPTIATLIGIDLGVENLANKPYRSGGGGG